MTLTYIGLIIVGYLALGFVTVLGAAQIGEALGFDFPTEVVEDEVLAGFCVVLWPMYLIMSILGLVAVILGHVVRFFRR